MDMPKDLFRHDDCPGHIFNTKSFTKDAFVSEISVCLLCYYTEGSAGSYDTLEK